MNVYEKLLKAREEISKTKIKKEGRNSYSNYDYFTPSQISGLVTGACIKTKLLTQFSLIQDEVGYKGVLTITNVENPKEELTFTQATDVPEIKATNQSQKLGGMVTFTERYLKMSAFEITDNNLDFDSQDNRPKKADSAPAPSPKPSTASNDSEDRVKKMSDALYKCTTIQSLDKVKKNIDAGVKKSPIDDKLIKPVYDLYSKKKLELSKK